MLQIVKNYNSEVRDFSTIYLHMIKTFIKVYNWKEAFAVWAYLIISHSKQFFLRFDNREVFSWPETI